MGESKVKLNVPLPTRKTARGRPQHETSEGCSKNEMVQNVRRELVRRTRLRVILWQPAPPTHQNICTLYARTGQDNKHRATAAEGVFHAKQKRLNSRVARCKKFQPKKKEDE